MGDIFKHIIDEIKFIETLAKTRKVKVQLGNKNPSKTAYFKKVKPKGFVLEISSSVYWRLNVGEQIKASVLNPSLNLEITDCYVRNVGSSIVGSKQTHGAKLHVNSFSGKLTTDSKKMYYRTVIPIEKGFNFFRIIADEVYAHDGGFSTRGLLKVTLSSQKFHVFIAEAEKKHYLFVDCLNKISLDDYSEFCWSILVSIGYLLGHLPQNEEYIFCYGNKEHKAASNFIYSQRRDTIKTFYTPINSNPYSWIKEDREIATKYYNKISEINTKQLSMFCQIVHEEMDIKAIVLLITESIGRSLLLMPAGLSVALEGLSEYFAIKNEETLKPIKDKKLAKTLRNDLSEILQKYSKLEVFTGAQIIQNKIDNINTPTNRQKLKAPFTILKIPLMEIDEEVLEYRNDFLHGNINLKPQKGKKTYSMDSFEISLRLLTLLNMALMKMIGYNGYIINHVKTQETGLNKQINEDYYREI